MDSLPRDPLLLIFHCVASSPDPARLFRLVATCRRFRAVLSVASASFVWAAGHHRFHQNVLHAPRASPFYHLDLPSTSFAASFDTFRRYVSAPRIRPSFSLSISLSVFPGTSASSSFPLLAGPHICLFRGQIFSLSFTTSPSFSFFASSTALVIAPQALPLPLHLLMFHGADFLIVPFDGGDNQQQQSPLQGAFFGDPTDLEQGNALRHAFPLVAQDVGSLLRDIISHLILAAPPSFHKTRVESLLPIFSPFTWKRFFCM